MTIVGASFNQVQFIVGIRPMFGRIQKITPADRSISQPLWVSVPYTPHGTFDLPVEGIIIRNPGSSALIGLHIETQNFSFITVCMLCMVGPTSITKLPRAHIARAIKKVKIAL